MTSSLRTRLRRAASATLVLASLAAVGACGTTEPVVIPIEQTTFADTLHINLANFTKLPSGMYVQDNTVGTGATLTSGHTVGVHYVGYLVNGVKFDSNVVGQAPFSFTLGAGRVIPGFDIGIQGMNVGGRRTLIIPPELAYGADGNGPVPGYAVLVFVVDAVSTT